MADENRTEAAGKAQSSALRVPCVLQAQQIIPTPAARPGISRTLDFGLGTLDFSFPAAGH